MVPSSLFEVAVASAVTVLAAVRVRSPPVATVAPPVGVGRTASVVLPTRLMATAPATPTSGAPAPAMAVAPSVWAAVLSPSRAAMSAVRIRPWVLRVAVGAILARLVMVARLTPTATPMP